ncbi:MAG: hypothetical protein A2046_12175 [Bacteroidetes bacterium GWA2_30_7]|nr:MAG: hypothetical protein A2046_12175 [Bacteroidetes bacterium GWA2_30_7]
MFFYLSKILLFLITPITWILGLLIYSIFTKNIKRKKRGFIITLVLFLVFTNSFIVDEVFRFWEIKALNTDSITVQYDYGIVLGGVSWYDKQFDRIGVIRSFDRVYQAVELYKLGKIKKIFLSGGSGSIVDADYNEAAVIKSHLIIIGIPSEDIEYEDISRNTRENAIESQKIIPDSSSCLLITSAFHMRRAKGCFENVGFKVTPYVVDRYSGDRRYIIDHLIVPNVDALSNWTLIMHEISGYVVYFVMGYL